jgi:hypothetical protein
MTDLSELEQHVLAFYVANNAQDLNMVGRFWPTRDVTTVVEDKIQIATRKFGTKVSMAAAKPAKAFADEMIEGGGFSTKHGDFGSTMHQFQPDKYKECLKQMREANPIVQKAQGAGPEFWQETFAELTGAARPA